MTGRTDYEERKEQKIDRLNERAEKAHREANALHKKAERIGSAIPPGQPIPVGHHSEGRYRADVERIETAHRKSAEASDKAGYYADRAETVENNRAISGDNPEAVNLYRAKLIELETAQARMKSVNAYWRKHKTMKGFPGFTDNQAAKIDEQMKTAYSWVQKNGPFESWRLGNNNAEIRRIKEKLESLSRLDNMAAEIIKFEGGEMRVSLDINRVQFIFDGKPPGEIRSVLKHNGFRWTPSEGAWQRQRTLLAVRIAKDLIPRLEKNDEQTILL